MVNNIFKVKQIVSCQITAISFALLLLINSSQSECKMPQSSTIINPVLYADYQSSSYLPGHPRSAKKIFWMYKTGNDDPVHLSLVGNLIIIGTQETVTGIESLDGNLAWVEGIRKTFNHTCTEEGVLINVYFKLRKYTTNEYNRLLITTSKSSYLTFLKKNGSIILYGYKNIYKPVERGEAPWEPKFRVMRYEDDQKKSYVSIFTEINSTLLTKDDKNLILLSNDKSYVIHPLGDMINEKVIPVSHNNIQCGSLSESGDLLLVEKREKGNYLKCSSLDGKQKWETELPDGTLCNQPPACTPKGNILYMAGDKLVSVNDGTIQWSTGIDYIPEHNFLTAFGNNSAIVVTGTQLVIIDDYGKVKLEMQLPFKATCRPIIGPDGAVYAGGSDGVCCIK